MYMPEYKEYSLWELHEALDSLNKEKYPERREIIEKELERRKSAGEVLSFYTRHVFWPHEIPINLGFRLWWGFTWRTTVALIAISYLSWLVGTNFGLQTGFLIQTEFLIIRTSLISIISIPIIGTFFIVKALAKKYSNFRIYVEKNDNDWSMSGFSDFRPK